MEQHNRVKLNERLKYQILKDLDKENILTHLHKQDTSQLLARCGRLPINDHLETGSGAVAEMRAASALSVLLISSEVLRLGTSLLAQNDR